MKIRRYTCKDMQEAMQKVKMDLGSEAMIISSKKVKAKGLFGFLKKPLIEVLAAVDDDRVITKRKYNQNKAPSFPQFQQPSQLNQPHQSPQYQPQSQGTPAQQYQPQPQVTPAQQYQPQPQVTPAQQYQPQPQVTPAQQYHPQQPQEQQIHHQQAPQQQFQDNQMPATHKPVATGTQPYSNQNPTGAPSYAGQAWENQQGLNAEATDAQANKNIENTKISELEDKVRNMEITLDKVYKAVSESKQSEDEQPENKEVIDNISQDTMQQATTPSENNLVYLRNLLFERDVEPRLIEKILEKIRDRGGNSMKKEDMLLLASKIMTLLMGEPAPINLEGAKKPYVVILLGPTGVGKTTTLAKIAADFTFRKKKVGLITADTYRIAAVQQLKTYAEILNLQVTVVYSPSEINDAVQQLSDKDLILIDTAGRSHKNKAHFDELKSLVSAVNANETFLVVNCNTSRIALREILEYYAFIKDYKLLFTKLDESPVCGIILNARYMTGKPISYTTNGQSVPDDMSIANVNQIVADILSETDL